MTSYQLFVSSILHSCHHLFQIRAYFLGVFVILYSLLLAEYSECYSTTTTRSRTTYGYSHDDIPPLGENVKQHTMSFILTLNDDQRKEIVQQNRLKNWQQYDSTVTTPTSFNLQYDYNFNELITTRRGTTLASEDTAKITVADCDHANSKTNVILLIHPIGVRIGNWYYNRLLQEMSELSLKYDNGTHNVICLVPELLGCGSACNPIVSFENGNDEVSKLPLLKVNDWADQLMDFMVMYDTRLQREEHGNNNIQWSIVSNGGCVPIALEIGRRFSNNNNKYTSSNLDNNSNDTTIDFKMKIANLILSATPSADSLLSKPNQKTIQKSYNFISGILGELFWWNALRNNGKFIQKFSQDNLAANAINLGPDWTPDCVHTAKAYNGKSKYSTFAFLAGSLNDGRNEERLNDLSLARRNDEDNNDFVKISIITGRDGRSNPARSWFWEQQKQQDATESKSDFATPEEKTSLVPVIVQNGNGGKEYFIGGRRCPAHEDASGFAMALSEIM